MNTLWVVPTLQQKLLQLSIRHFLQGPETQIRETYKDMTIYYVQLLNTFSVRSSALLLNDFIHSSPSIQKFIISEVGYS